MEQIILDSSAVIALFNENDLHNKSIAKYLEKRDCRVYVSVLSAVETLVKSFEKKSGETDAVNFQTLPDEIIDVNYEIAVDAARIRAKYKLLAPDALICATANYLGATLVTFDKAQAKAHSGSVLLS